MLTRKGGLVVNEIERDNAVYVKLQLNISVWIVPQQEFSKYQTTLNAMQFFIFVYLVEVVGIAMLCEIWGSLSLPSRFNPDLGLFGAFGVDLSTSSGRRAWDLWESNPR